MEYEDVLQRVDTLSSELGEPEAADARRVVAIVRALGAPGGRERALGRELNRLSETLARRSARALPAAALARAALADLWGDASERERTLLECDSKLELFGL